MVIGTAWSIDVVVEASDPPSSMLSLLVPGPPKAQCPGCLSSCMDSFLPVDSSVGLNAIRKCSTYPEHPRVHAG